MRLEKSVEVDADQQRVWDVLSDIESWPDWVETVDAVELLTSVPAGVGSRVRLKQPRLPESNLEIVVWDPPSYFEMRQKSGGVTSLARHQVESLDEGRSRLTLSVEMRGWLVPIIGVLSRRMTIRYMATEVQDLKRAAESSGT